METSSSIVSEPPSYTFQFDLSGSPEVAIAAITVALLLILLACLYGAEEIFMMIGSADKSRFLKKESKTTTRVLRIAENPEKFLVTLMAINRFIGDIVVIIASFIGTGLFNLSRYFLVELIVLAVIFSFILAILSRIIHLVFQSVAKPGFAVFMAYPVSFLIAAFSPLVNFMATPSTRFAKKLAKYIHATSMADFSQSLDEQSELKISDEKNILEGIVKFNNKRVAEIMKPRVDVETIDIKTPYDEVLRFVNECGFSRIPVIADSFDKIQGILFIKDLLPYVNEGNDFDWRTVIRPPYFVPETKMINRLLSEFRKRKVHIAIVVDEYGGSAGIVTLEDILEEIVGEINDESDEEEALFSKIEENKYSFDGKTLLVDFYNAINADEAIFEEVKGEADTLAGFILELKGEIPPLHEQIFFENYVFTIEAVNDRRIEQIRVEIK